MLLSGAYDMMDLLLDKVDQAYFTTNEKNTFLDLATFEYINKHYKLYGVNQESRDKLKHFTIYRNFANGIMGAAPFQIWTQPNPIQDYMHLISVTVNGKKAKILSYEDFVSKSGDSAFVGGDASSVQGSFYFADGILRASDGNHTANTGNTKWYGYVDKSLFQTTNEDTSGDLDGDGDSQAGTPAHYISEWTSVDSSLKKLSELGVSFDLDGVGTGPNSGTVGSSIKKIIVSYWKYEKGDWSGVYQIGVTPVYIGGQEGPMDIFTETINAAEEKISFQFFLTTGTSATISKNASHILGDNRIIGLNFWFRPFGDEDWHLLSDVDLLTGGKHHWKVYNSGTDTVYGIFYGTVAIAEPVKTSTPSTDHWSYTETTVTVTVDNDNSQYLAGRSGFVRVHGFLASPVYFQIPDFEDDTYSVPDTNKGEGIREIKVELLDEQFSILKEGTREYEVQDSGKAQPEDYSDVNDPRS